MPPARPRELLCPHLDALERSIDRGRVDLPAVDRVLPRVLVDELSSQLRVVVRDVEGEDVRVRRRRDARVRQEAGDGQTGARATRPSTRAAIVGTRAMPACVAAIRSGWRLMPVDCVFVSCAARFCALNSTCADAW